MQVAYFRITAGDVNAKCLFEFLRSSRLTYWLRDRLAILLFHCWLVIWYTDVLISSLRNKSLFTSHTATGSIKSVKSISSTTGGKRLSATCSCPLLFYKKSNSIFLHSTLLPMSKLVQWGCTNQTGQIHFSTATLEFLINVRNALLLEDPWFDSLIQPYRPTCFAVADSSLNIVSKSNLTF